MKTLDQIYRYTYDCRFPEEDWQKILTYCRERFKGGKIHKAKYPKSDSTYKQFMNWIDNGFGSGDMVSYGKTMGIVSHSTPESIHLAAYCDYDGNLIVKDMKILDASRLSLLDESRRIELNRLMFDKRLEFYVRRCEIGELYTPKKYFYVAIDSGYNDLADVGMYLESDGCKHHFLAFIKGNKLKMDCWIDAEYTPLRPAEDSEIQRLHAAASKAGWSYNERLHQFVQIPSRGHDNAYWYLNDRFEIVMDRDDGSRKHTERFNAGNYFVDNTEAVMFMKNVRKIRGKA